jgi:hypothetical protein
MTNDPLEEKILRRIPAETVAVAAAVGTAAAFVFDILTGLFFFSGGVLASLGFLWLKLSLNRLLLKDRAHALRSGVLFYLLRLALLLAVFSVIIFIYPKRILAFAAGFSTVIPVFLAEAALALARLKQWKD